MAGSMRTFVADGQTHGADFIGPPGGWAGPKNETIVNDKHKGKKKRQSDNFTRSPDR